MKRRKNKSLAIGILCCMLVFMGIGYAALSQVLKVTTTGNVTGQWKIYIDSADLNTETNTNKIIDATKATSSISSDKLTATTNVSFNEPGEYALYDIVVKNAGNIDAELKNINLTTEANLDNFDVETIGLGTGIKNLKNNPTFSGVNLLANNELSFQLKITFDKDKNLTELPSPDTEYKFTISMNYVQKTSNTSGGGGGTTDDPNAPDFTVDDTGKIVAYNSSKITENDGYVVIPATNSEGKAITTIDKSSFAKSNITIFYTDDEEGAIIDAATEEEYLKIKARVEELMNEDGSGSGSGSGSYSSGSSSMAVKNLKPEMKKLNNLVSPDIVKVSGSGSGSGSGSMTIYWSKEKTVPEGAEVEKGYFNLETGEMEESVSQFKKIDLTQATSLEEIGDETFYGAPLTSIKFNEGLKRIGESAFGDSKLSGSIELPNSLESIGDYAFQYCQLTSVKLPSNLNEIGNSVFGSNQISSIELPNSLTTIGDNAFSGNQISTLVISSSVTTIGNCAFSGNQLTEITIPNTVKSLGSGAFSGVSKATIGVESIPSNAFSNSSLNELILLDTVRSIGNSAFYGNQLTNINIPAGLTTIDDYAFSYNQLLASISIPASVTTIGDNAFTGTYSLTTVNILGDDSRFDDRWLEIGFQKSQRPILCMLKNEVNGGWSITGYEQGTDCNIPETLTIPAKIGYKYVVEIADNAFANRSLKKVIFEDTEETVSHLSNIGGNAFSGNQLTEVEIPSSVTAIGYNAFGENQLTEITIPNTVKSLGRRAFSGVSKATIGMEIISDGEFSGESLKELILLDTVKSIGESAFANNQITTLTLPNSLTTISNGAFSGNQISTLEIPSNITTIGSNAFSENQMTSVIISNGVTRIGTQAFSNNKITNLIIPSTVNTIESGAFANNQLTLLNFEDTAENLSQLKKINGFEFNQLTSVAIPNGVTEIGTQAFYYNQIASIKIPSTVNRIESNAFGYNQLTLLNFEDTTANPSQLKELNGFSGNRLTSVVIPSGVTAVESSAFSSNQLTNITIPSGVTTIESGAFSSNQLTNITIPNSVTKIGTQAFYYNKIANVEIPASVQTIQSEAFSHNQIASLVFENTSNNPSQLKEISGFDNNQLTEITIPNSVTAIGDEAFLSNQLTKVTIPSNVEAIGSRAFEWNNISTLEFEGINNNTNKLTKIGFNAFFHNKLSTIAIPSSVTTIETQAFYQNPNLTTITIKKADSSGITLGANWNGSAAVVYDPS